MICRVRRGNLFQWQDSDNYTKASGILGAGGAPDEVSLKGTDEGIKKLASTGLGATDGFVLNGTDPLDEFPIGTHRLRWDHGYTFSSLARHRTQLDESQCPTQRRSHRLLCLVHLLGPRVDRRAP